MPEPVKDTSEEAAGLSLAALLTGEGDKKSKKPAAPVVEDDDEEEADPDDENEDESGDAGDGDDDAVEDEDEDEGEGDGEDDEDEDEGDDAPKGVSNKTVIFTELDENGKKIPVTVEEARAGRMRNADYTRKTSELAEERKATQAERTKLINTLNDVLTAMSGEDEESTPAKLAALARTDPEKANQLKFDREARAEERAKIEKARNKLAADTAAEQEVAAKEVQKAELAKLIEAIPDMADPEKADKVLRRMTTAAVHVGYKEADMNLIADHRLMKLLQLAEIGLRLSKKKAPIPEPKGTKIPALRPGVNTGKGNTEQRRKDEKFSKTRSVDDAVDSLYSVLVAGNKKRK